MKIEIINSAVGRSSFIVYCHKIALANHSMFPIINHVIISLLTQFIQFMYPRQWWSQGHRCQGQGHDGQGQDQGLAQ